MLINRRNLLGGMLAIPAIVSFGSLMRVSKLPTKKGIWITPGFYMREIDVSTITSPMYDIVLDSGFEPAIWYDQSGNGRHVTTPYVNVRSSNLAQVLKDHSA